MEIFDGGAIEDLAISVEARAVARAIPGFLGMVPINDATEMRANRPALVPFASLITIDGNLFQTAADDCASSRSDRNLSGNVSAGGPIAILRRDVQVFFGKIFSRAERFSRRIVQSSPRILAALDQVGEQHARDGAVRDAVARVAGRDVNILLVHGIAANKSEAIDWFHHLAGPAEPNRLDHGKAFAGPLFQTRIASLRIIRLAGLVVFAAND